MPAASVRRPAACCRGPDCGLRGDGGGRGSRGCLRHGPKRGRCPAKRVVPRQVPQPQPQSQPPGVRCGGPGRYDPNGRPVRRVRGPNRNASRRAANRRRRHKYQKFPSNQRREFLFTSVLPGVITYSNVPPSGAYAISLPEGGLGWGRIYLLSHAGCAGSSAVRASARLMPSARATPSPYDGSAL